MGRGDAANVRSQHEEFCSISSRCVRTQSSHPCAHSHPRERICPTPTPTCIHECASAPHLRPRAHTCIHDHQPTHAHSSHPQTPPMRAHAHVSKPSRLFKLSSRCRMSAARVRDPYPHARPCRHRPARTTRDSHALNYGWRCAVIAQFSVVAPSLLPNRSSPSCAMCTPCAAHRRFSRQPQQRRQ